MDSTRRHIENLANPADESDEGDQLSMFGRSGQLALPGATAQLGLDGAAYAPNEPEAFEDCSDRSPERASRSLGTHTGFCTEPDAGGLPPTEQLGFSHIAVEKTLWDGEQAGQLTLWPRFKERFGMVRDGDFARDAACCFARVSVDADAGAHRNARGSWITTNTIKCQQFHTCPYCAPRKCRETASALRVAMDRHLDTDGEHDVWMLTLEIPHYSDQRTEGVVQNLYDACAALWRSIEWRRFVERWGVVGRVRVLDVTHGGANGSHPHFHVAVFVEKSGLPTDHAFILSEPTVQSWTVDEGGAEYTDGVRVTPSELVKERERYGVWKPLRACSKDVRQRYLDEVKGSLVTAWERCVRGVGVELRHVESFRRHALALTPAEHAAAYFTKWGLADEVGMSTAKDRNSMRLLDLVAARVKGAAFIWKMWRRSIHGKALVTGLADICKRLNVTDEDARAWLEKQRAAREAELEAAGTPVVKVRELRLVLRSHLYDTVLRVGFENVFAFVDQVEAEDPAISDDGLQRRLDDFLWSRMAVARGSPDG